MAARFALCLSTWKDKHVKKNAVSHHLHEVKVAVCHEHTAFNTPIHRGKVARYLKDSV